jgi:hypothetical protein
MPTLANLGEHAGGRSLADLGSMEALRAAFPQLSDEEIMRLMASKQGSPAYIDTMERMMRSRAKGM